MFGTAGEVERRRGGEEGKIGMVEQGGQELYKVI